jgi:predicted phosphodiesterase
MRLAVLTDVHGNLTALDAVIADLKAVAPDLVVQGGDLVSGGHRPVEVLDRVRERAWPGVVGNTDEMLWKPELFDQFMQSAPTLAHIWRMVFEQQAPATKALIGPERLSWLREMPIVWRGHDAAVVHAGASNVWRSPMANATDEELAAEYGPLNAAIVAYGHIHVPFIRPTAVGTICNCGSVGMPFDGDPRASYLLVDAGVPAIRRVAYDVESEVRGLLRSGYPDAERIAETLRTARYVLPPA